MEKIFSIRETEFKYSYYNEFIGIEIITEKRILRFGISNIADCCESWDQKLFGKKLPNEIYLKKLNEIDDLNEIKDEDIRNRVKDFVADLELGDSYFICSIETDIGQLIWTCYNDHNGYYGHPYVVYDLTNNNVLCFDVI
jgi:hypothetical protein